MTARVVVAHAGRQYSHQLALALHERDSLHEYWTGLPLNRRSGSGRWLGAVHPAAAYAEAQLPPDRVRVFPAGAAAHFLERQLRPSSGESVLGQLGDYAADAIYARRLRHTGPTVAAVIGYENGALRTFRAARALGVRTILDAASIHHATADRWMGVPPLGRWGRHVRRHKDLELQAADHILVLSKLARDSYVAAGVSPERIDVVPLGYDPAVFQATAEPQPGSPLCFVFIGNAGFRKGFDLLLAAARQLSASGTPFRIVAIGDVAGTVAPGVELRGKLGQRAIAAELARADCLVLPSRCDSFGMVVAEALGSGACAIVSENTGAKDLVVESQAGWTVSASVAALVERMRWCVEHPQAVLEAKRKARVAATTWTWERYRARAADTVLSLLGSGAHG